ncbi:cuticle protein 18.7-like [Venturia canescens]|uniref:cuticle protein 18.7-like n=1 Tax=Venturia canescens TaxID=32260 RepID=UPI001C9CD82F|nr:cuticle protein 18.7-like [Venturia canescens]
MMGSTIFVLFASLGLALARPSLLGLPSLAYTSLPSGGAPVGPDGRVVDTPEVAIAKIQHAAAQLNERSHLANAATRSGDLAGLLVSQSGLLRALASPDLGGASLALASLVSDSPDGAPVGSDGRVVDTPAVAHAKAQHAVAHLHEKLNLSNEAARNSGLISISAPSALALRL